MQAKKDLEEEGELRLPKEGGRWSFENKGKIRDIWAGSLTAGYE